jgi:putative N6-adenine-specific DNA methylase
LDNFFAIVAPGLESLNALELRRLGLLGASEDAQPQIESGGVAFSGTQEALYRANLHLRTASRVILRIGDFYSAAFSELRKKTSRLEWERYLQPGQPVRLHVTCHKSRLYHSDAVAERVAGAIGDRLGQPTPMLKPAETEDDQPPQLVIVRLVNDHCSISMDSSGALLHRRGYRQASAKAPLRETLAAGMLLSSNWDVRSPLIDPFCGSGTIAIETAMMRAGLPPGMRRRFAFMDWPGYEPEKWEALLAEVHPMEDEGLPPIQASDRDAGAIEMAHANAERAGVAERIEFACQAVSAIQPPPEPGWVVTNPPYGLRLSEGKDVRNLYAQLGNVLRRNCPGWHVAILCSDKRLLAQTRLKLDTSFDTENGGIKVWLGRGLVG